MLSEELRQAKEAAQNVPESVSKDDRRLDNSLNGMCLADELCDEFSNQECSFVSRTLPRIRKRPSSILSVALAKMDQSACIEPSKKARLSIPSIQTEELDFKEVKEIREYLVELQVLSYGIFRFSVCSNHVLFVVILVLGRARKLRSRL